MSSARYNRAMELRELADKVAEQTDVTPEQAAEVLETAAKDLDGQRVGTLERAETAFDEKAVSERTGLLPSVSLKRLFSH